MPIEVANTETTGTLGQIQIIPAMTIGNTRNTKQIAGTIKVTEMMTERFLQAEIARWTNIPGDIYTCLLCNVLYKYIIQRIYGYTYIVLIIHVSKAMQ
jgi:hypothetical protein